MNLYVGNISSSVQHAELLNMFEGMGQVLYAKQQPRKFERGTDLHTQANPLPMCHRPGVLVKLTV